MKNLLLIFAILIFVIPSFCHAQTITLWGTSAAGGKWGQGNVFKTDLAGVDSNEYSFSNSNIVAPYGSLILANNGLLYGLTYYGGTDGNGMIFSFDVQTGAEADLYNFNGTSGSLPNGSLFQGSDGLLYGMTLYGGVNNEGAFFSFDIDTKTVVDIHDFGSTNDGQYPRGSLMQASDSLLYGLTNAGGIFGDGSIFDYNIYTHAYSKVHDLGYSDGEGPRGSFIKAGNGLLYAITGAGGANGFGTILSFNITTKTSKAAYNFKNTDGKYSYGSLLQASDSLLYGMTTVGGTNNYGVIFSFNITKDTEMVLHSFGSGSDGQTPNGSLMQASNGLLYGLTEYGGTHNMGTIFTYNIAADTEIVITNFSGVDGNLPLGDLVEYDAIATSTKPVAVNDNHLSVSPNPCNTCYVKGVDNAGDLLLTDLPGRKIDFSLTKEGNGFMLNLPANQTGMYLLKNVKTGEVLKVVGD